MYSVGRDRLVVYPTGSVPEKVYLLDYPAVSTSKEEFDGFAGALSNYLSEADIGVHYLTEPATGRSPDPVPVLVIATGALPADRDFLNRIQKRSGCNTTSSIFYLGTPPDGVVVDSRGNVDTSPGIFPATERSRSPVRAGTLRMKESAYTLVLQPGEEAAVKRSDGLPAVYRTGCMTVFTNTIGSGWDTPEDAAWDTFVGIVTGGRFPRPVAE
ncbi:MAG: hypothetical protein GXO66_06430, partial [Euryarchaeota archaeon]|nr:hypothetical protein [Euryarchaeota archaeon]